MNYFYSLIFVFCIGFLKSQTGDSLSVTVNPFQKRTLVKYSFTQTDTVSLLIYNLTGQTSLVLKNDVIMASGYYQDSIIMDAFSDGIYFMTLKLGTRKLLKTKLIKTAYAGIEEFYSDTDASLYPIPSSDVLNIKLKDKSTVREIEIFNASGSVVMKSPFTETLNLESLPDGIYFLNINTKNNQSITKRFIKQ